MPTDPPSPDPFDAMPFTHEFQAPEPTDVIAHPTDMPPADLHAYLACQRHWSDPDLEQAGMKAVALYGPALVPSDRHAIAVALYERARFASALLGLRRGADSLLVWAEQLASLATGVAWPAPIDPAARRAIRSVADAALFYRQMRAFITSATQVPVPRRPDRDELRNPLSPRPAAPAPRRAPYSPPDPIDCASGASGRANLSPPADSCGHRFDLGQPARCQLCGRGKLYVDVVAGVFDHCRGSLLADLRKRSEMALAARPLVAIVNAASPDVLEETLQIRDDACCQCGVAIPDPDGLFHFCPICVRIACSPVCWDRHVEKPHRTFGPEEVPHGR